jgi:hypothetical protein
MPLGMDPMMLEDKHTHDVLVHGISPLIVALILRSMWAVGRVGGRGSLSDRGCQVSPAASVPMESLAREVMEIGPVRAEEDVEEMSFERVKEDGLAM